MCGQGEEVVLLDYGAGNVQSILNAVGRLGARVREARSPEDIRTAPRLLFPGVGAFGTCMAALQERGFVDALKEYLLCQKHLPL